MANDGHPLTVHVAIALQVIHHFGRRPRPDADGPPAAAIALHAGLLCKPRMETVVHRIDIRPVELEVAIVGGARSEEHTSELQSLMRTSYAGFWLKKTNH